MLKDTQRRLDFLREFDPEIAGYLESEYHK